MRIITLIITLLQVVACHKSIAQQGYNYYKSTRVASKNNAEATRYFQQAYYDHIWRWSRHGADSAVTLLNLAIEKDSAYGAAYAFLGHVYQFQTYDGVDVANKFRMQKLCAEKAMRLNPAIGDSYTLMADVRWHEGDTLGALQLLRKAVAMEPDHVGNWIWLGIRYSNIPAKRDSAMQAFRQIIRLDPQYGQAYMKLGNTFEDSGLYDSARHYYRKAIEVYHTVTPQDRRMAIGYVGLGQVLMATKKYDSAILYYNQFIRLIEPTDFYVKTFLLEEARMNLVQCYERGLHDNLAMFIESNQRTLNEHPADPDVVGRLFYRYSQLNYDSIHDRYTLPMIRSFREISTGLEWSMSVLMETEILSKRNRNNEAMQLLQKSHRAHPNEPLITLELARLYARMNDEKRCVKFLQLTFNSLGGIVSNHFFLKELHSADFSMIKGRHKFISLLEQ